MNIRLQIEKQKYKEEGQMGTELDSGSEEYREYKELAENIYRDYCGADNTVDKRHYKKKGDNLHRFSKHVKITGYFCGPAVLF